MRLFSGSLLIAALAAVLLVPILARERAMAAGGPSCGEARFSKDGVAYRVLFAKNGAVQQYVIAKSSHNIEEDHDVRNAAEAAYGAEGVNAPPLQILTFRRGPGGMMIPDKAVDSCGRVTRLQ